MKVSTLSIVAEIAVILCGISFVSTDELCGDGAFLFHNECYLWQRGNCPLVSVHIRDKCCNENCVRSCTALNCWHCCENIIPSVTSPPPNSNSNQVSASNSVSNCNGASCTSCNQNQGQPSNCSNCGSETQCNQGGCQQTNCCTGSSATPCNQSGCQQTNCCNGGSGTPCNQCQQTTRCNSGSGNQCNQCGCQQTSCNNGSSGTPCNQGGCHQTNCNNGSSGTPCNQGGCQQTNCNNGSCGTPCNQGGGQQTNCNNGSSGTPCNQGGCQQTNCNNGSSGTPCNQGGGQQSNCNNIGTGTQPNWPFSPVIPTTSTTTTTTTTTTTPVPYTPPPASIQCPPGTVPIGRTCRTLYCPKGTIMKNNECIIITCPEGTVWNGYKCVISEPISQNITFYNTIITQSNATKPDINLSSNNNFTITLPLNVELSSTYNGNGANCINSIETGTDEATGCGGEATEPLPPAATKCCTVMTPRTCELRNNQWYCYSRRYQRCGDFCTTPVVYLKPPRIYSKSQYVVMPPLQMDGASGAHSTGVFDCSGCARGDMQMCSNYCYRYSCPSQSCGFYDQQKYCANYPGSFGCMEDDGCFDNQWCS